MANWIDRTQRMTSGSLKFLFAPQLSLGFKPARGIISGFVQTIAMFLATARLIPPTHRALRPLTPKDARMGEVLALAYATVRQPGTRVDQMAVFGAVVSLLVLLSIVTVGTIVSMIVGSAHAAPLNLTIIFSAAACTLGNNNSTGLFDAPCPTDMAQQWIDMLLLGQTNWFQGQVASIGMRAGLEGMFQTYSYAMLVIAGFLVMYHIMAIVAGTAHAGKMGGGVMHTVWAPIRLVLAIGMLIPVGVNGLNSGQIVVVQVAKWGSALASNVWLSFASGFASNTGAMLIMPPLPQVTPLLRDTLKILVCQVGYQKIGADDAAGSFTLERKPAGWARLTGGSFVNTSFDWVNLIKSNDSEVGACGNIRMADPTYVPTGSGIEYLGSMLTVNVTPDIRSALLSAHMTALDNQMDPSGSLYKLAVEIFDSANSANLTSPNDLSFDDLLLFNTAVLEYRMDLMTGMLAAVTAVGLTQIEMVADATARGWVSAGVWFNTIARINGLLVDYAQEVPVATPEFKRRISGPSLDRIQTALDNVDSGLISMISWAATATTPVTLNEPGYLQSIGGSSGGDSPFETQLKVMASNFSKIMGMTANSGDEASKVDSSIVLPAIAANLQLNTANPLAELSALGNRIILLAFQTVETLDSCRKSMRSGSTSASGACSGKQMDSMGSTFMSIIGGAIVSAGVTLAYVLPMIPFIRFMFGILTWILSLFESVIAIPVVALAHIKMDGEGLASPMARSAYLLLLQLFVRPTLMIFGLIIALLVFNLMIVALNEFYSMAIRSAEGGGSMSAVAAVVYTVMYSALAYAFANASFKAIDQVPQQVLQWIGGQNVNGIDGTSQVMGAVGQTASIGSSAITRVNSVSRNSISESSAGQTAPKQVY